MEKQMGKIFDVLLGRKTYEIFASYWPNAKVEAEPAAEVLNSAKKYVASTTLKKLDWKNSELLKVYGFLFASMKISQ